MILGLRLKGCGYKSIHKLYNHNRLYFIILLYEIEMTNRRRRVLIQHGGSTLLFDICFTQNVTYWAYLGIHKKLIQVVTQKTLAFVHRK